MRKNKVIILIVLFVFILAGHAMGKDLSPEQLQAMLEKVEQQKFDTRDVQNKKVEQEDVREKAAGIFKLVERIQNLKAQIKTPTAFGTLLVRNNLTFNNSFPERSSIYAPLFHIRFPEIFSRILRDKKSFMLSSLPVCVTPAGLTMVLISFLIVALGILPLPGEPRFRFQVQLE